MARVSATAAAILLAAGAAGGAEGAGEVWTATYDVYLGGLSLAAVEVRVERDGAAYSAEGRVETTGLAWLFAPTEGAARAFGRQAGDSVEPARFTADGRFGDAPQRVEFRYGGGALGLSADPPLRRRPYDPAPETLEGALDPLSAAVAALAFRTPASACGRTVRVFDSRRRYDLRLGPAEADGDTLRCEGRYVRVSGFKAKHMALPDHPFTAVWRVTGDRAELARAETPTNFGHGTLIRR